MVRTDRIFKLIKKHNIKQKTLSEAIGVSAGNISDWKSGRSSPSAEKVSLIAEFFNVSTDYLLDNSKSNEKLTKLDITGIENHHWLSDEEKIKARMGEYSLLPKSSKTYDEISKEIEIVMLYNQLNPANQERAIKYVKELVSIQNG